MGKLPVIIVSPETMQPSLGMRTAVASSVSAFAEVNEMEGLIAEIDFRFYREGLIGQVRIVRPTQIRVIEGTLSDEGRG